MPLERIVRKAGRGVVVTAFAGLGLLSAAGAVFGQTYDVCAASTSDKNFKKSSLVNTIATPRGGGPAIAFGPDNTAVLPRGEYDISADDQRFLMIGSVGAAGGAPPSALILVENWFEELKEKVRR